jgi:hypothetical protein
MILLDTDHLSVLTDRRAAGHAALLRRLELATESLAIPIVAAEEQCQGWLAKIARTREIHQQIAPYERLAELFDFLAEWDIVPLSSCQGSALACCFAAPPRFPLIQLARESREIAACQGGAWDRLRQEKPGEGGRRCREHLGNLSHESCG